MADPTVSNISQPGVVMGRTRAKLPVQIGPVVSPSGIMYAFKTVFERLLALALLVFLTPLFLIVVVAIIIEDPGSPIFVQQRYGRKRKPFGVFKFRTMRRNADQGGAQQTQDRDPRITRVGALLRKSSMDELPQIVNVLLGDMAILGPRAHPVLMEVQGALPETLDPRYHLRHRVRPGISGWAQVNGSRGALKDRVQLSERIDYDIEYIRNWSFWLDLKIYIASVAVVLGARGAK